MTKEINYKGFTIVEKYGDRRIEDVFKEAYELFYGVYVIVERKEQPRNECDMNHKFAGTANLYF
ncbi:hypothetical protein [Bacillus thuringiensis]|uniref:hypothetical protein n=1 Tax=Bacillus thuringiensis TaxID=1428 RepID=UPI001EE0EB7C|nr:hypothetical protein [Bacillus thuringiensis]MCG3425048.1 hypothetical protein [Bacillus thuringiensis]